MEFRKILYMKNKDINTKNCTMSDKVRKCIELNDDDESMVLRILVDHNNKIVIEYVNPICLEAIRDATKLDALCEGGENNG